MPLHLVLVVLSLVLAGPAFAQAPPSALPAMLPDKTTISPGAPKPIDGMWRVDAVSARVRIEGGRIYALDPWIHLFIWQIVPGMVVTRDIGRVGPGVYEGTDLPNAGPWRGTLNDNQQLMVVIQTAVGPLNVTLTCLQPDDPAALRQERAAQVQAAAP